ncbi:MAG: hypothetical protein ABW252_08520 [Polyangiales bacterium]
MNKLALTLVLVASSACADDDVHAEPATPLRMEVADAGAPSPALGLGRCGPYVAQQRLVYSYAYAAEIIDAAASPDGYAVIAVRGVDIPMLKLARTPDGRSETNLHTLIPEPLRTFFALSEIRDGKVLVAHGPGTARASTVSALDLAAPSLSWSRTLDDGGATYTSVRHVSLREDGRYEVLASLDGVLYLLGFAPDGSPRYRTLIHRGVPGQQSAVAGPDGSTLVALDLDPSDRRAFGSLHGHTFSEAEGGRMFPVLLTVDGDGKVTRVEGTPSTSRDVRLTGNLTTPGGRPTWFARDLRGTHHLLATRAPNELTARALVTPFREYVDGLYTMASSGDDLYVAGLLDQTFGFKAQLRSGTAFLARVGDDGAPQWACAEPPNAPRDDPRALTPPVRLRLHPAQVPMLSVVTGPPPGDAAAFQPSALWRLRVFVMDTPREP